MIDDERNGSRVRDAISVKNVAVLLATVVTAAVGGGAVSSYAMKGVVAVPTTTIAYPNGRDRLTEHDDLRRGLHELIGISREMSTTASKHLHVNRQNCLALKRLAKASNDELDKCFDP